MSDAPRRIEYVPLADVIPAPRNPRAHSSLPLVRASIDRFGFVDGAVHDGRTGRIVAGHGRLEALTAMEAAGEHPPDGVIVGGRCRCKPVGRAGPTPKLRRCLSC